MNDDTVRQDEDFHEIPLLKQPKRPLRKFLDHVDPDNPITQRDSINYLNKIPGVSDGKGIFALARLAREADYPCKEGEPSKPIGWHRGEEGFSSNSGSIFEIEEIERVNFLYQFKTSAITYLEIPNKKEEKMTKLDPPMSTRTLGEFWKMIIEWAEAPGDALPSIVCREILEEVQMSEELYNSFKETFPDGPVNKFLKGNKRANVRNKEIPMMTPEQEDFVVGLLLNNKDGGIIDE